jgi:hypothetical protein
MSIKGQVLLRSTVNNRATPVGQNTNQWRPKDSQA